MPRETLAEIDHAWRQCDLVPLSACESFVKASVDLKPEFQLGKTALCIISQDCDIVADLGKEPFVDMIAGNPIRKISGEYANTRNPRCLHVESVLGPLSFSIHDRFRAPKSALRGIIREEAYQFNSEQRDILRRWVGRRYLRAAFPDAFNQRLNAGAMGKLEKSALAEDVSAILLSTTDDELAEDSDYHIKVILGIRDGLSEERMDELEIAFVAALSPAGIVVDDIRLSDEDDITYRNLRTYKRLEKDYRSLPDDGKAASQPVALDAL